MSGKKISELQELLALENDDLLLVVDSDESNIANKSKSVKISTLKAEVGSGGGAVDSVNNQTGTVVLSAADVDAVAKTGDTMSGDLRMSQTLKIVISNAYLSQQTPGDFVSYSLSVNGGPAQVGGDNSSIPLGGLIIRQQLATFVTNALDTLGINYIYEHDVINNVRYYTFDLSVTSVDFQVEGVQWSTYDTFNLPNYGVLNPNQIQNLQEGTRPYDAVNKGQLDTKQDVLGYTPAAASDLADIQDIFEFQHEVAYENNAAIYANGQPGVEDSLLRSGWYYENLVSGQKINWYFFDGNPLSSNFMADIEVQDFAAYAVVTFDSIVSKPFLSVYTRPTGTNDIIPGFAHSSYAYSQYSITPEIGRKYLIHIGEAPAIHPELERIQLGLSIGLGDQDPTEMVLTSGLSSDSGASVGSVKFVAQHVGVNAPNLKANAELKIAKQNLLVSGNNIKTVNGSSLLGSGNLVVSGGVAESAESLITNVFNASGSPIAKMSAIYINGNQGDQPKIVLAQANSEMSSSKTYGLVQTDIPNMSAGVIVEQGRLENLDTDVVGWVEGDALWLSPTVAGGITNIKPSAPNHVVFIGYLIRKHQNVGVIQVSIQNGYEIQELHNVSIPATPANGDVLAYELSTSLWKNKTLAAADIGAATTSLSNLVTTAIPSGVDIISNSGSGVQFDVKTANSSTGATGIASFGSGSSTAGGSSYTELISGTGTTSSGAVYVESGKSLSGGSGAAYVVTGAISSGGLLNNLSNTSGTGLVSISSGFTSNTSTTTPTGLVQIFSGATSGSGGSGTVSLNSGQTSNAAGTTGTVTVRSGDSVQINATASTGQTLVRSGNVTGTNSTGVSGSLIARSGTTINGNSGQAELTSGAVSGIGQSGAIVVRSGATNSGNSGQVEFSSGSSTSGNSGNTIINTGTAGGTRGNIYLLSPVIFTNNTATETVVTTKNEIVAANTIDLLNMIGSVYHKNLTENTAFTFIIPSNSGKKFTIVTKNATGSSYTVNFPTVKQKAGTINNTVAANTTSIFEFLISDNEIYCISCIDNIV